MNRYIFTVTAGRSGQNTLANLIANHVENSYVAFEEPKINYLFKGGFSNIERIVRRKFIETHELLGRGKVLSAFEDGDVEYIEKIATKKLHIINKNMIKSESQIYVDISKYFARGLHIGFNRLLPKFSLIHLVRDPVQNMKSFLNRDKNFYLDNVHPNADNNLLKLDFKQMKKSDLYLWSWCEMVLRYEFMKNKEYVDRYTEIHTDKLSNSTYINKCLDDLGIKNTMIKESNIRLNTNIESGYRSTQISKIDIEKFEQFIEKVPKNILEKIPYLRSYNPYLVHNL